MRVFRYMLPLLLLAGVCGCRLWPVAVASDSPDDAAVAERLSAGRWTQNPDWSLLRELHVAESTATVSPTFRWRFAGRSAEELLDQWSQLVDAGSAADVPPVTSSAALLETAVATLRHGHTAAAANAAVLWAQLDASRAADAAGLLEQVVTGELPALSGDEQRRADFDALQAAAAEAWCRVLVHSSADPVTALAPAGRLLDSPETPEHVRSELLIGVGRYVAPALVPGLNAALAKPGSADDARETLRRAALLACVVHAFHQRASRIDQAKKSAETGFAADAATWPPVLLEWRAEPRRGLSDPDRDVRHGFLVWLAAVGDPRALELARQQRRDADPHVRERALVVLAVLGTDDARAALLDEARQTSGPARARVVHALGGFDVDALASFVDDPAWQVQQAVAEGLARHPTPPAAALLRTLTAARAPQVQVAVLNGVRRWPDELAIPVLLAAMQDGAVLQRATAFEMVRRRRGLDAAFDHTARDGQRRAAAVAALVREFELPAHLTPSREAATAPVSEPTDGRIALTLPGLDDADVAVRRRSARRLADLARARSLDAAAVAHLRERLVRESDVEVWRYSVEAILPDATPQSASIAAMAAGHAMVDIRVLACRYALRHRRPEFARWLKPLFEDSSRRVQLAAIEAAGRCGDRTVLEDDFDAASGAVGPQSAVGGRSIRGLRSLLTDANLRVRVAAAVAMCHLDDRAGIDELLRMSYTPDPGLRREIAAALAELSHPALATRRAELQHPESGD